MPECVGSCGRMAFFLDTSCLGSTALLNPLCPCIQLLQNWSDHVYPFPRVPGIVKNYCCCVVDVCIVLRSQL